MFREVTWPNSALGAPQPGYYYTMALVPGYQIFFEHRNGSIVKVNMGNDGQATSIPVHYLEGSGW